MLFQDKCYHNFHFIFVVPPLQVNILESPHVVSHHINISPEYHCEKLMRAKLAVASQKAHYSQKLFTASLAYRSLS